MDVREINMKMNQFRKEPEALQIGSPFRIYEYCKERLKGKTPEQALRVALKGPLDQRLKN